MKATKFRRVLGQLLVPELAIDDTLLLALIKRNKTKYRWPHGGYRPSK